MKKNFIRLAVLLMAGSLLFAACKKNATPSKTGDDNKKEEQEQKDDDSLKPLAIVLDGIFDDWDAITEDAAKSNSSVALMKGGKDDPIQMFKIANDAEYVYFYIEYQADQLPQNEACGTWGNSYDEDAFDVDYGDDDEQFREVMHLFIDPDGNSGTGFFTFADESGEPAIPDLGCEMCAQFFMFFKPSTGLASVAWEQTIIGPTKTGKVGDDDQVDGSYTGDYDYNGTICQEWPDSGDDAAFPLWGWQNPDQSGKGDNDCPRPENWKPAKVNAAGIAKVEFAVEKDCIVNLTSEDEEFACGIIFDWDEHYQAIGSLRIKYVK